jgi:hypothetical protein
MKELYDFDIAKMTYGQHAIEIPINFILQETGEDKNKITGIFQSSAGLPLTFGGFKPGRPHMMVIGQMIFRPMVVVDTAELIGRGIGNIYMCGFIEEHWQNETPRFMMNERGETIINEMKV